MKRITREDFAWLDPWGMGKGQLLKVTDELLEHLRLTDEEWQYLSERLYELKQRQDEAPPPEEER